MSYREYQNLVQSDYQHILAENVLFWNLWNTAYPFEILGRYSDEYREEYDLLKDMWNCCWEIVESNKMQMETFKSVFEKTFPFEMDEDSGEIMNPKSILERRYEEYNDDILPELCINQLIYRFDSIYKGITANEKKYGEHAHNSPIETIALIVASNDRGFVFDNMDLPIVGNEVEAQVKLIAALKEQQSFGFKDRNIFRSPEAMHSLSYIDYID
ncbi:hypothetical protein [Chitinophaga qingshengii]|uniref:Uncharacterized protein n=1 Tax=Chitinophaga qingshengii TaxID=1569794 RepID=A0ABR7THW2_9BACT|nr:hypothetical protein [Chitinophaga qingshengii]MBC9930034.1 hypothetical protein [Chitinophaga qingshengii]